MLAFTSDFLRVLKRAFSKPLIGVTLGIYLLTYIAFAAIPVILPLLAISYFGFDSVQMSYVFVYFGAVQVLLEGFIIGRLTRMVSEERLIAFDPLFMVLGMLLMPLFPSIPLFLGSAAMVTMSSAIMQTAVPSFVSKKSAAGEQGEMLGVSLSEYNIAFVPGPLLGGFVYEWSGSAAPFFLSAGMLAVAFVLGCRVFHACR